MRLVHVTTVPMSLRFLAGQVTFQRQQGFDVHVVSSPGEELDRFAASEAVEAHAVPMQRAISPLRDLVGLGRLWRRFRSLRPGIVHAHTPKAGLLAMVAARLAGVPVRIYHVHGLPLLTRSGLKRRLLWLSEWVACRLAHQVLCVSRSVRGVAVAEGLCAAGKCKVLLGGSINGVDPGRFRPPEPRDPAGRRAREELGLPAGAPVLGFVGRLVPDKGLVELAEAWRVLREEFPTLHLLVVGPYEAHDPLPAAIVDLLVSDRRVHLAGLDWDTPRLYRAMDVLALPSYREGFNVVLLEAAAMGLPAVATRVPGCTDAVVDGVTGTLVPPRDAGALAEALRRYLRDPTLRRSHGEAGRARVLREFRPEAIWEATTAEYRRLLAERDPPRGIGGRPRPAPSQPPAARTGPDRGASAVRRPYRGKVMLDRCLAGALLLLAGPLLTLVALLVWGSLGRPILFRQARAGLGGRVFTLYKFRTMRDAMDAEGRPLPDATRLTRLGRFLRSTSLDELPSLLNILRGDLSLVGPRPLLPEYLPRYSPAQLRRHAVPPGLTGWAQVNGRNRTTWQQRFALDLWYVDHASLWLDLEILVRTLWTVALRNGISHPGEATMPPFTGSGAAEAAEQGPGSSAPCVSA